jgi:hypothetical protein
MDKYSLNTMIEKYRLEYSVMKPATSSLSASGISKGTRLHSTRTHTLATTNNIKGISTTLHTIVQLKHKQSREQDIRGLEA